MPCTFDTPCGNAKRFIMVTRGREQYACLNAHTLWNGPPPFQPVSHSDRLTATLATRRKCGYHGCMALPRRGWTRCGVHKGKVVKAQAVTI